MKHAQTILDQHIKGTWNANTRMIKERYNLTTAQVRQLKSDIKNLAAEKGVLFQFDPARNVFVCPPVNTEDYKDVALYGLDHWISEGRSWLLSAEAMVLQGQLGFDEYYEIRRASENLDNLLLSLSENGLKNASNDARRIPLSGRS